jgi:hypothetical protein
MYTKTYKKNDSTDYWKYPEKPFPIEVKWKAIAPKKAKLSVLQQYDVIFDNHDCKIRQLPIPEGKSK